MATVHGIKAGKAFVLIEAVDATAKVLNQVRNRIGRFGSEISQLGTTMALRAAGALTPIGLSLGVYSKFDDSMRIVEARARGSALEMGELREQAKLLGATTAFTATHIGNLMARLAQMGRSRSDIAKMTEPIMLLARAAPGMSGDLGMDIMHATDATSQLLDAFQLKAGDTARVTDLLSAAVNNSKFSLEEMSTALGYAAPIANNFNVSIEDTLTALAGIRQLGVDASIAGTAFRNMMLYVSQAKERDDFNKKLQELTGNVVDFTDANENLINPLEMVVAIAKSLEGVSNLEASDLLTQLFETRAVVPAMGLGKSVDLIARMRTVLEDVTGTAKRTHDQMETGLGGTFRVLESAAEAIAIAIGESLDKALIILGVHTEHALNAVRDFIVVHRGWIVMAVGTTVAIGALGISLIVLGQTLRMLSGLFYLVTVPMTLFGLLFTPGGALIGGLIAAIVLIPQLREAIMNLATGASFDLKNFKDSWVTTFDGIATYLAAGQIEEAMKLLGAQLKVTWAEILDGLSTMFENFVLGISGVKSQSGSLMLNMTKWWHEQLQEYGLNYKPGTRNFEERAARIQALEETLSGMYAESQSNPEFDRNRSSRKTALESYMKELKKLQDSVEIFRQLQTEAPNPFSSSAPVDAKAQADALLEAAKKLITPGEAVRQVEAATGGPNMGATGIEALKQFQENREAGFLDALKELASTAKDQDGKLAQIEINTRNNGLVGV